MAAVQHRATTRTSNTDNSTTKTKSKATSARKSPATKRKRVSAETARAAAALKGLAVEAPAPSIEANEPGQFGRINVMDITPAEERGIFPARVELGEPFEMTAQVFIEGRTKVGATAIVRNPRGKETMRRAMTCVNPGLDRWTVMVKCGEHSDLKPWEDGYAAVKRQLGEWTVTIEGWEDAYVSWLHDARIKVRVMDDVDNALNSGAELLARWAETPDTGLTARDRKTLEKAAETMADQTLSAEDRLAAGDNPTIAALHETHPLRDGISPSQPQRFKVERPKSSFAAWYQFFPRSEGATIDPNTGKIIQGTLKTSMAGLERAAAEGFDIVYLPPVFPIGVTNRKGRNNTLVAGPDDPGSPFGIGSELGGHDTVDPLLGTMDDFKALCQRAHELGLEIALDFALQCSPDHPWVKAHPNWFRHKPDGSIAFAENPPKKYQDIYPIDFNADMPGIEKEVERIMNLWIEAGVTIFRIDNPHTKPVRFWQDVIAAVTKKHPEILFLAEAFTRPGMMRALSYVGFTQSHCYFPWRNTKDELEEYLPVTNGDDGYYQHNTFWPTTPDILTAYVRDNGVAGLGYLQRLRTHREQAAPRLRRADRQREVRGQGSRLEQGQAVRRGRDAHRTQQDSSRPPGRVELPQPHRAAYVRPEYSGFRTPHAGRTDRYRPSGHADCGREPRWTQRTPVDDSPGTQRAGSAHRPPAQRARRADRPRIPVGLGQLRVSGSLGGCGPHPVRAVMRYCNGNATVMPLTCMGLSCA